MFEQLEWNDVYDVKYNGIQRGKRANVCHFPTLQELYWFGIRYHAYKDGAYWGPNDDKQNEQLDIAFVSYDA